MDQEEYLNLIRQHFNFLFEEYEYEPVHSQKYGRSSAFTIIGLRSPQRPSFQFKGELGPNIWIGLPDAPMKDETTINGKEYWWGLIPILAYLLDRPDIWLEKIGKIQPFAEGLIEYASIIEPLMLRLVSMFEDSEAVSHWHGFYKESNNKLLHNRMLSSDRTTE